MARRGSCSWKEYDRLQSEKHGIQYSLNTAVARLTVLEAEVRNLRSMHDADVETIQNFTIASAEQKQKALDDQLFFRFECAVAASKLPNNVCLTAGFIIDNALHHVSLLMGDARAIYDMLARFRMAADFK